MSLPQLLKFRFVLWCSCPNTILDSFMDIIIISASDYQPQFIIGKTMIPLSINIGKMRESLNNRIEIMIIFSLIVWPSLIDCVHYFCYIGWIVHFIFIYFLSQQNKYKIYKLYVIRFINKFFFVFFI